MPNEPKSSFPVPGEVELAPQGLQHYIGQGRIKERFQFALDAAKLRDEPLGHILLLGPPDSGKATLAKLLAKAIGQVVSVTSGLNSDTLNDFAGILTSFEYNHVWIFEDVQSVDKKVAEALSKPLKDFKMDLTIEGGAKARSVCLNLAAFTVIATATRTDRMSPAFLSSFQIIEEMETYDIDELT